MRTAKVATVVEMALYSASAGAVATKVAVVVDTALRNKSFRKSTIHNFFMCARPSPTHYIRLFYALDRKGSKGGIKSQLSPAASSHYSSRNWEPGVSVVRNIGFLRLS